MMAITKSNKLELSLDHNKPNKKMDAHLLLSCTWKVFLSWTNEQEYYKRDGGDVFIHPTVKSNRYQPTQQNTHWPDAPVDVTGRAGQV
jgi:hypothetical protein